MTIIPTFDYELYLGSDSGSVDSCLLGPTDRLLEVLHETQLNGVFFVDALYLLRLKEVAESSSRASEDLEAIGRQLVQIGKAGHDVFPHLHPHWLDAVYDPQRNRWALEDYRYYTFGSCEPKVRDRLMEDSVGILQYYLGPDWKRPLGYRAGGWCIQPFGNFRPVFEKWGVAYDFSVVPGFAASGAVASYDFRSAPHRGPYRFTDDVCRPDSNGIFGEFPISVVEMDWLDRILHRYCSKVFWRLGTGKVMGSGKGVPLGQPEIGIGPFNSLEKEMASLDHFSVGKIAAYCRSAERDGFLHLCSHPKLLSMHGLAAFTKLIKRLRVRFVVDSDWRAMVT